jgi:FkbM family methyltransferase
MFNFFSKIVKNRYRDLGISDLRYLIIKNQRGIAERSCNLFGHRFYYSNAGEFKHGLNEIYGEQFYLLPEPTMAEPLIIDGGANIGLSTLFLKRSIPKSRIICFEPDAHNFSLLQKNCHSCGLTGVELHQSAVWNENSWIGFSTEGSTASKIDPENQSNLIQAERLKDFITQKVYFLKLDIEGAEYQVLMDIKDELHWVDHLFVEYHGVFEQNAELNEILTMLQQAGFKFYIKEADNLYRSPFFRTETRKAFDVQLNIFAFR